MTRLVIVAAVAAGIVALAWLAWGMSAVEAPDRRTHLRGYGRAV